jgi:hypothetical protein
MWPVIDSINIAFQIGVPSQQLYQAREWGNMGLCFMFDGWVSKNRKSQQTKVRKVKSSQ